MGTNLKQGKRISCDEDCGRAVVWVFAFACALFALAGLGAWAFVSVLPS